MMRKTSAYDLQSEGQAAPVSEYLILLKAESNQSQREAAGSPAFQHPVPSALFHAVTWAFNIADCKSLIDMIWWSTRITIEQRPEPSLHPPAPRSPQCIPASPKANGAVRYVSHDVKTNDFASQRLGSEAYSPSHSYPAARLPLDSQSYARTAITDFVAHATGHSRFCFFHISRYAGGTR